MTVKIREKYLSNLSDELKKRVEAAKTPDELLAIAKETNQELSPDQLEAISGGESCWLCASFEKCIEKDM